MPESEPWPLLKGVARLWPNLGAGGTYTLQCHFCLGLFQSRDRRRCYGCKQCRNAMHNSAHQKSLPDSSVCPICREHFTPSRQTQTWCSAQCRKLAWYRRKRGILLHTGTDITSRRLHEHRRQREQGVDVRRLRYPVAILSPQQPLSEELMRRIEEILASSIEKNRDPEHLNRFMTGK